MTYTDPKYAGDLDEFREFGISLDTSVYEIPNTDNDIYEWCRFLEGELKSLKDYECPLDKELNKLVMQSYGFADLHLNEPYEEPSESREAYVLPAQEGRSGQVTPTGASWFYEQYEEAVEKSSFEDEYCCHPKVETLRGEQTLQEAQELRYKAYAGAVHIDVASQWSGVSYPVGTASCPVNNLADAIAIAEEHGFDCGKIWEQHETGDQVLAGTIYKSKDGWFERRWSEKYNSFLIPEEEIGSWAESLLAKDREFKRKINEKKADEIALALSTPESRAALLKAMVEFKSFDFQSIGRKLFMVDELPQGAYARYENNNADDIAAAFALVSIDLVADPVDPACRIKKDDPAVCAPCFPLFVSTSMRENEETTISELMMRDI